MVTTQVSYAKVFLFNPLSQDWSYTNPTGSPITFDIGTVFGINYSANKCVDCVSTATDGSQKPYGILSQATTVPGSATVTLTLVDHCEGVNQALLIFTNGTDTLATTVSVGGDVEGTMLTILTKGGIRPVPSVENTFGDN